MTLKLLKFTISICYFVVGLFYSLLFHCLLFFFPGYDCGMYVIAIAEHMCKELCEGYNIPLNDLINSETVLKKRTQVKQLIFHVAEEFATWQASDRPRDVGTWIALYRDFYQSWTCSILFTATFWDMTFTSLYTLFNCQNKNENESCCLHTDIQKKVKKSNVYQLHQLVTDALYQ